MVMVVHRAGGAGLFPSTVSDFRFSDFPEIRCTLLRDLGAAPERAAVGRAAAGRVGVYRN